MQAFVMPAPIPESDPIKANIWHPKNPVAYPRLNELYIKMGVFVIIIKSQIARFTTNTFDGVRNDFALDKISVI